MKKVEIIIQQRFFEELRELMNKQGIMNYSVLDIFKGHSNKGDSLDYGFLVDHNIKIFSICSEDEYLIFKEKIGVYVKSVDGLIYASTIEIL